MTYLTNSPDEFAADALRGFAAAHPQYVTQVHGGVVRSTATPEGQPALVVGGGSGHYPAFAGWVGPGIAHGSPCGNIFSSPSASQVYSVARSAENGGGVILGFGNYAGDVLHFGAAAEKLRAEGIDVRIVKVSDDVASNSPENHRDRRGIAGDLPVFKITGTAIEAGADLDEAERIARKANDATRSFGVAFDGCTLPGAHEALFHVEDDIMALGLGIHGEPGIQDVTLGRAAEVADLLFDRAVAEEPDVVDGGYQKRVAVMLNGLGTVKYEELFVVYGRIAERLAEHGLTVAGEAEVGEFVTSLNMAGLSLTLVFLDEELEGYWTAPVDTPAYRRGTMPEVERPERTWVYEPGQDEIPAAATESRELAARIVDALGVLHETVLANEAELGRLDAVAGDGDHGQGMAQGSRGAHQTAQGALDQGAGARTVLVHAGSAWSEAAGGTSGALWGAALTAAGRTFDDQLGTGSSDVVDALVAAVDAVGRLGGAKAGDKTIMDAAIPFRERLVQEFQAGGDLAGSLKQAAADARAAADRTADLEARLGRSRVLGEKSKGTPDPGAVSFALLADALADWLAAAN